MGPPHANATPRPVLGRLRTASAQGNVEIRSPIPDQQTMMGAYVKNIEKLEQSAEELSQGGSDIGEEIRKMKQEQDRASRRSSLASREGRSEGRRSISALHVQTRSRNASASSYSNSIVDVNTAARWGGYSPGGYLTSPSVSRVSSFHRPSGLPEPVQEGRPLDSPLASPTSPSPFGPAPIRRSSQQSISRSHHEDIMSEHLSEPLERHDETREEHDEEWDVIKQQQQEEEDVRQQHMDEHMGQHMNHEPGQDYLEEGQGLGDIPYVDNFRSNTPDTYRQARTLFHDFDGVHFSPTNGEFVELDALGNEVKRVTSQEFEQQMLEQQIMQNQLMQQQRLSQLPRPTSYAHPSHPPEGMVYYPAPVPRMLNLPKRLSQVPAANVQVQRHSHIMQPPRAEARKSAPWLPALDFQQEDEQPEPEPESSEPQSPQRPSPRKQRQSMMNPRLSRMSMANLPPQLRASVYFDQSGSVQLPEVRVKSESAVATLDSILAASVNAPVNVFTDHPFAGPDRRIYAKAPPANRRSNLVDFAKSADSSATEPIADEGRKRAVSTGTIALPASGYQKRNSIVSMLTDLGNPGGKKLKKRNSKMSLATDLGLYAGEEQNLQRTASDESGELSAGHEATRAGLRSRDDLDLDAGEEDEEDTYAEDVFDERYPFAVQPSSLLAELQMRKAHQKTRNRNATGYTNGMHSTLLQMDAVAQVEKAKKQSKRTRLAWEDPSQDQHQQDADEDEDVPLGVLFPARDGLNNRGRTDRDWNRPIGLLERRELEDHEPLARRRNRLRGISPDHHLKIRAQQQALLRQQYEAEVAAATVALPPDEDEDEHADEPLGQRLQRLKRKQALNAALGDLAGEDETKRMSAFTDDVLGQFGVVEPKEETPEAKPVGKSSSTPGPAVELVPEEEETLGQRRARMQREKSALQQDGQRNVTNPESAGGSTIRPPFKTSVSLANLLAVHPVNTNGTAVRSRHDEPIAGSLLAMNGKAEAEAKQKLREQNAHSYSVLPREPISSSKSMSQGPSQNQSGVAMYQQQLQMQQQQMQYAQQQQMYPQMTAGMGTMGTQYNPMMYPQFAQPTAYTGMNMGMPLLQQNMYGQMPAMQSYNTGVGAGVGSHFQRQMGHPGASTGYEEAEVPAARRDLIDRWRLSVAQ
ncbi:hypothetical protein BDV97DRAFT_156130 [Delphinella strobiligena]|nr:hypothetical protein BDV97DRAFT_156130 [Delphinella strobiligena]